MELCALDAVYMLGSYLFDLICMLGDTDGHVYEVNYIDQLS